MNKKLKIAVLGGGPSSEYEVSLRSAAKVVDSLDLSKYQVLSITIGKDRRWDCDKKSLEEGAALQWLKAQAPDVVFIALHGTYGEDGTIQQLLESIDVCYTGSGVSASATAMDKVKSLQLFTDHGLHIPQGVMVSQEMWQRGGVELPELPVVIKPVVGGSSVGMSMITKPGQLEAGLAEAFKYDDEVLVEDFIEGTEVTCGVLDDGEPMALPPTEIHPKDEGLFDYEAKYKPGASEETTPARLPAEMLEKIKDAAITAHLAIGCYGMSRSDMIVRGSKVVILETNTIPGLTETSLIPQGAAAIGLSFAQMADHIITSALKRYKQ